MTGPVSTKPSAGVSWRLLDGYPQDAGGYDEMLDGGDLRAHCEPLVRSLETLGPLARKVSQETEVGVSLPGAHHFGHR